MTYVINIVIVMKDLTFSQDHNKEIIKMKTMILAAVAAFGLSGAALAEDFTDTAVTTTATYDIYEFSITGSINDEFALSEDFALSASADVLDHTVGMWDANVELTLGYANVAGEDLVGVAATYELATTVDAFTSTVELEASYIALADDMGNGETFVTPTLGLVYAATDTLDLFGEVSYTWQASDEFAPLGGAMEAGVIVALSETVDVAGSVIRTFDTGFETTQAAVEVTFNF